MRDFLITYRHFCSSPQCHVSIPCSIYQILVGNAHLPLLQSERKKDVCIMHLLLKSNFNVFDILEFGHLCGMALLPYEIVLIATLFSVLFLGPEDSTFYRTHRMKNLPAHSIIHLPEHTMEQFVDIRERVYEPPL